LVSYSDATNNQGKIYQLSAPPKLESWMQVLTPDHCRLALWAFRLHRVCLWAI